METMLTRTCSYVVIEFFLISFALVGCTTVPIDQAPTAMQTVEAPTRLLSTITPTLGTALPRESPAALLTGYEFPDSIHPELHYLFYLHGKILEDQGLPAVSPDFGVYEYEAILEELTNRGFTVISEQRSKDADINVYAQKTIAQLNLLRNANVPSENITVVGASKGAYIAATVSSLLENEKVNFALLGACNSEMTGVWKQNQMYLYGNILAIYDSIDEYAGSCEDLYAFSQGKGIARHQEIVLHLGMGHGILYKPLDEWITPIVEFAEIDLPTQ